jgi:hypothetical protein
MKFEKVIAQHKKDGIDVIESQRRWDGFRMISAMVGSTFRCYIPPNGKHFRQKFLYPFNLEKSSVC